MLTVGVMAFLGTIERVERALSLLPPYRCARDLALDIVFGPPDDFEYTSTTAPSRPPPSLS